MTKKLFISLGMLMCVLAAGAQQTKEELQKRQQELQKEIADLNSTFDEIKKNKKQSLSQLAVVQRKIRAREELVSTLSKDLRLIDDNIYLTTLEMNRMKRELDTLKQNYAQSLVFAYKNRSNYDYLNFIFSATSFNDALKRMNYLKSYRQYRETQVENIVKTQQVLQQKSTYLSSSKVEKNSALKEQGKQLTVLEDDKKEKDKVVQDLKDRESDVASEIKNKQRMQKKISDNIVTIIRREAAEARRKAAEREKAERDRLAKEEAARKQRLADQQRQEAAAAKAAAAQNNTAAAKPAAPPPQSAASTPASSAPSNANVADVNGVKHSDRTYSPFESTTEGLTQSLNFESNRGRLPWPVDAGYVSIPYGQYEVPNSKLKGNSEGIEISLPVGATVKSVADGEVSSVFDLGGGEQAVLVMHGKYFTTYSHLGSVNVNSGQKVKAGTVIGKAGASDDGDGMVGFMITNEKGSFLNPVSWLKHR
ncbi:murein hydrolase activator EnvC family protein [Deminuibacter soli]|nr:peptidoglycan DD-metalloendopeptidase family protein [Deminuibacter soli]